MSSENENLEGAKIASDVEARKQSIFQKVGRNVVNLQRLEVKLKLLQSFQISAPMKGVHDAVKKRRETIARQTLGSLTHEFVDKLFPLQSPQPEFENLITETWITSAVAFERDNGQSAGLRLQLRALVDERNALIHHMFGGFDPRSSDSCERLEARLVKQGEQIAEVFGWVEGIISGVLEHMTKIHKSPGQLLHLELKSPVTFDDWRAVVQGSAPGTTFHDHSDTFGEGKALRITTELKTLLDDFGEMTLSAVFAVRNGTVEGVWLDPLHNFVAYEFTRAASDPDDVVLIQSLTEANPQ